jgi:hypothetical protein
VSKKSIEINPESAKQTENGWIKIDNEESATQKFEITLRADDSTS